MEKVNKCCLSRPNLSEMRTLAIGVHNVHPSSKSLFIGITFSHNSKVNQTAPPHLLHYFLHTIKRETGGVDCEVLEIKHVVDITPDCVNGQSIFLEVLEDLFKICYVFVTPAGLLVAQTPERRNSRASHVLVQLQDGGLGVLLPEQEPEVENTPNDLEREVAGRVV